MNSSLKRAASTETATVTVASPTAGRDCGTRRRSKMVAPFVGSPGLATTTLNRLRAYVYRLASSAAATTCASCSGEPAVMPATSA